MNKPKHTPGPWTGGYECINSPDGRLIANVWYSSDYNKRNECSNFSVDEGKANSRLIAAAPELLEALDKLVTRVANDEKISKHDEGLHRCIALIRKATGGANE